jgi:membrane protein DedA with SNARE-associated domain
MDFAALILALLLGLTVGMVVGWIGGMYFATILFAKSVKRELDEGGLTRDVASRIADLKRA